MARIRLLVEQPRARHVHEIVDAIMATMAATDAAKAEAQGSPSATEAAEPRWSGPWPKGGVAEGFFGTQTSEPPISHGNFGGAGWTAGRRMHPGELMSSEDLWVQPVDAYDDRTFWHDFGYDQGWRDLHRALAEGYSNADALMNFHYRVIDDDRRLAREVATARANTWFGEKMRASTPSFAEGWARDRDRMINELRDNADYRAYVGRLKPAQLFEHTMPRTVGHELIRINAVRAGRHPYWSLRGNLSGWESE